MKLLRVGDFGSEIPAILDAEGHYRDISTVIPDLNPSTISNDLINDLKKINLEKLPKIDNKKRIGPCISNPGKFIGVGLNYSDHAAELNLNLPKEPVLFSKATSCICGPNDNIILPPNSVKTDWEVEIGFVISKKGKNISVKDANNYIFGYLLVCDVSERDFQNNRSGQWLKGKSADTFGPIGPYLVTNDDISDLYNLKMSLDVNGVRMQTGNTSTMIHKINYCLSYISEFMTLLPGDIITTGTPPGVGLGKNPPTFLKKNDKFELSIDDLGSQKHLVI
jgi:2-keto-4-pentenoate hydratase/2-oxohepta-3-ene-1,7-dioic acid hydratase in catechol pathway